MIRYIVISENRQWREGILRLRPAQNFFATTRVAFVLPSLPLANDRTDGDAPPSWELGLIQSLPEQLGNL